MIPNTIYKVEQSNKTESRSEGSKLAYLKA